MSLRAKIAFAVFLAVGLFLFADNVLQRMTFQHRFQKLDYERAQGRMRGVLQGLSSRLDHLEDAASDLASRLPGEDHLREKRELVESKLPLTVAGEPLHLVLVIDPDGMVYLHRVLDPSSGERTDLRGLPNERISPSHPLRLVGQRLQLGLGDQPFASKGLIATELGPMLVATRVLEAGEAGSRRLIVGRFLDQDLLEMIAGPSGLALHQQRIDGRELDSMSEEAIRVMTSLRDTVHIMQSQTGTVAWALIKDIGERPALLFRAEVPEEVAGLWADMRKHSLLSMVATIVLFPLALLWLLQWIVTGPLFSLTALVKTIGHDSDSEERLGLERSDEIGELANEFDCMLDQLRESRAQLVRTARLAGMSEVSSAVLHNVGNALNGVSVGAGLAQERIRELPIADLRQASDALNSQGLDLEGYLTEHPQGKHLPAFLAALVTEFDRVEGSVSDEIEDLDERVGSIAVMINALQASDVRTGMAERFSLGTQVQLAIELCCQAPDVPKGIAVECQADGPMTVLMDRHKLMDILYSLVRNALDATEALVPEERRLEVRVLELSTSQVCVVVRDNGVGIEPDRLQSIFGAGQSTKPEGAGLGLHLASTAVGEMGGSLSAHSDGLGQGAVFRLMLPTGLGEENSEAQAA